MYHILHELSRMVQVRADRDQTESSERMKMLVKSMI